MSTIKSSNEDITINADGSGRSVKFQANGVEKASIDSSGNFTSTSIDATKLSGALPAIDGSALTGVSAGKVLQVVQGSFSSSFSTTSTGQVASGYTASITPTTSGNKILVFLRGQVKHTSTERWGAIQIKDTTNNTFSDNIQTLARGVNEEDYSTWHLFTTTSTSSHTYEMYQGACDDQTKIYSKMIFLLMEIAQ